MCLTCFSLAVFQRENRPGRKHVQIVVHYLFCGKCDWESWKFSDTGGGGIKLRTLISLLQVTQRKRHLSICRMQNILPYAINGVWGGGSLQHKHICVQLRQAAYFIRADRLKTSSRLLSNASSRIVLMHQYNVFIICISNIILPHWCLCNVTVSSYIPKRQLKKSTTKILYQKWKTFDSR